MKARMFPSVAFVSMILVCSGLSQKNVGASDSGLEPANLAGPVRPALPIAFRPFTQVGLEVQAGLGGLGFEVALPLLRKFNLRAGADFFSYSTTFQEQGATVAANLRMRSGHASLDWFPFRGRFRLSPLVVFANNNRVQASALIPPGSTITLDGSDYISSSTDPLHGGGSIDFRRVSPGFTLGWGNILRRGHGHLSFPLEAGFYYLGQPGLKVSFSGSACDPALPQSIGCMPVGEYPAFQENLTAFIARTRNNLSYASYFPIVSLGVGYAF